MRLYEIFMLSDAVVLEAVGGNYLYHATSKDIDTLKNILSNGLITNVVNTSRTGSILPVVSFTRSWRYALKLHDDGGRRAAGVSNGVILVFDADFLNRRHNTENVSHGETFNFVDALQKALREFLNPKSRINTLVGNDRIKALGSLANKLSSIQSKFDTKSIADIVSRNTNGVNKTGLKGFIMSSFKTIDANRTEQAITAEVKKAIAIRKEILKLDAAEGEHKGMQSKSSGLSEYEEIIPFDGDHVPLHTLGLRGYMINPAVPADEAAKIDKLMASSHVKKFIIPGQAQKTGISQPA